MRDEYIVGLDIGTTKICIAVGKKDDHGNIKIISFAETRSFGVAVGMVQNIQKATEQISQVVKEASKTSNIEIKKANVGIAGKHIKRFTNKHFICNLNIELNEASLLMHSGLISNKAISRLSPQELVQKTSRFERILQTGRIPIIDLKKANFLIEKAKKNII